MRQRSNHFCLLIYILTLFGDFMIKHKTYTLENNKRIDVFDDVFPLAWRIAAYDFCRNSFFKIGWSDSTIPERKSHDYFLYSSYTKQDLDHLHIFEHLEKSEVPTLIEGLEFSRSVLNLSVPSDVNYVHTHPDKKIILYYINQEWKDGWHGETLFYNNSMSDIQFASPYTPGRVIVFDGDIPHCIRPQSTLAPMHRLTLTVMFTDKNSAAT